MTAGTGLPLVEYAARATQIPPFREGYGVVDAMQLEAALAHARAGTLPTRPSPDVNALYVEQVAGTEGAFDAGELPPAA